jgi:hypothetical protein
MERWEPTAGRVRVVDQGGRLSVSIPPRLGCEQLFSVLFLAAWSTGAICGIWGALGKRALSTPHGYVFSLGVLACLWVLSSLLGTQRITVEPGRLRVRPAPLWPTLVLPADQVTALWVDPRGPGVVWRLWDRGLIAVEAGGRTRHLACGIDEAEAAHLLPLIAGRLGVEASRVGCPTEAQPPGALSGLAEAASRIEPPAARVEVDDSGHQVEVRIRRQQGCCSCAAFSLVALWAVGVLAILAFLVPTLVRDPPATVGQRLFVACVAGVLLAGALIISLGLPVLIVGVERIVLTHDALLVRPGHPWWVRRFRRSEVRNLRYAPAQREDVFSPEGGGAIAFDYGLRTIRFGRSLGAEGAGDLIRLLRERLGPSDASRPQ